MENGNYESSVQIENESITFQRNALVIELKSPVLHMDTSQSVQILFVQIGTGLSVLIYGYDIGSSCYHSYP